MHAAYSIIFFTTASGAGYGILLLLALLSLGDYVPAERWLGFSCFALAFGLITFGLLSSTYHLGHPERAWRAFSQWRSSWLSREGVMAVLSYLPAGLMAIGWVFLEDVSGIFALMAVLVIPAAIITVYCTAMIYASIAAVPAWHNKWVPMVYLLLALYSGGVALNFVLALFGQESAALLHLTIMALVAAVFVKSLYWRFIDNAVADSNVGSATGLDRLGQARLLDSPHTQENYLQKEMGYKIARKHAEKLRKIASVLAFAVPVVMLVLQVFNDGTIAAILALLAFAAVIPGLLLERWLFFAEAKHKVTLYYGADAV